MEWMGHADLKTTQIYLAYKPKADAARQLSAAFEAGGLRPEVANVASRIVFRRCDA
jgi:hypothetical protein